MKPCGSRFYPPSTSVAGAQRGLAPLAVDAVEAAVLCLYLSLLAVPFLEFALVISLLSLLWYLAGSLYGVQSGRLARLGVAFGTLLESIIQLLINTISFVRVGAFALAHAGLSVPRATLPPYRQARPD